jgi:transcriptional antiterminator RfaH
MLDNRRHLGTSLDARMKQSIGWLVVMTKPKMETAAQEHLMRQGFEVYLPLWTELKRQRGVWQTIQAPMFPRYMFVRPGHAEQSLAPIRSTWGVSQLVRFGAEPAWAGEGLIHEIRQVERSQDRLRQGLTPFKKGDQVLVMHGPFKGVSAEVLSCDQQRVILLLQVLGRTQHIAFKANACQVK